MISRVTAKRTNDNGVQVLPAKKKKKKDWNTKKKIGRTERRRLKNKNKNKKKEYGNRKLKDQVCYVQ